MFSMISVEDGEFCFSDGRKEWRAEQYECGWGLQVSKGLIMYFEDFGELIFFISNEEKLWVKE